MDIRPIKTPADYKAALKIVESLMDARADSPEGDRLDVLATLIEAYERKHFPMDLPDTATAIKFRMEQQGLTVKDLEPMIGRRNRVYEVLNGTRGLTLAMIRKLRFGLNIPAESLIEQALGARPATSVAVAAAGRASAPKRGKRRGRIAAGLE